MGRASSCRGARPLAVSSHSLLGAAPLFSPHRLSSSCRRYPLGVGGYAPTPCIDPVFFDSLRARYARHRILCARLGLFVCVSRRSVVVFGRVVMCGQSGVLLGCERGRVGSTLASFFEAATMNACGAAHQGAHPGSPPRVIG